MDLGTIAVSLVSSGLVTTGITWVAGAVRKRRTAPVDSTVKLTTAAMLQVDQLQERVADAEASAARAQQRTHEVEQEAEDARQQVRAVRRECADLAERMAALARWIHDPSMTLERLRARVPLAPGQNGAG